MPDLVLGIDSDTCHITPSPDPRHGFPPQCCLHNLVGTELASLTRKLHYSLLVAKPHLPHQHVGSYEQIIKLHNNPRGTGVGRNQDITTAKVIRTHKRNMESTTLAGNQSRLHITLH